MTVWRDVLNVFTISQLALQVEAKLPDESYLGVLFDLHQKDTN